MAANVGYATLQIIPSARGFQAALNRQTRSAVTASGAAGGRQYGLAMAGGIASMARVAGPAMAAFGVGTVISDTINLEKQFSLTMNTMAAVADVPAAGIKELSALALKMGADTSFSANQAAEAMLELAKSGISAAEIQAGALAGTLTLAAAGGTDLATAATIASNAMNTFGLAGRDMNAVAAALAGGANASSASVESLGEALSQVGPGAKLAGLSIQETIAVLSAFDAAGIKGSDAGTSLKTMLASLVPQSAAAARAMSQLGLKFTDSRGNFVSIAEVAEQLRVKLGKLSEAEKTRALNTIFGSDASRAAAILMTQGAAGVEKYTKATSDLNAAQRVADARMSGTAGAIERMQGSIETAKLAVGQFLAPAVVAGANGIASAFGAITPQVEKLGPALRPVGDALKGVFALATKGDASALAKQFNLPPEAAARLTDLRNKYLGVWQAIGGAVAPALRDFGQTLKGSVLPAVGRVANYLGTNLAPIAQRAFDMFQQHGVPILRSVASFITKQVVPAVGKIAADVGQKLKPALDAAFAALREHVLPAAEGFLTKLREWMPTIQKVIMVIVEMSARTIGFAAAVLGKVLPPLIRFGAFLGKVLVAAFTTAISWVSKAISWVINFGKRILSASAAVGAFVSSIGNKVGQALRHFQQLPGKVVSALSGLKNRLVRIGSDLMAGLRDGISSGIDWVLGKVRALGDLIPDWLKRRLGIHSPSRVMRELGKFTAQGLVQGLTGSFATVKKTSTKLADQIRDTFAGRRLGEFAGDGFVQGVTSRTPRAQSALRRMVAPPPAPSLPGPEGGLAGAVAAGSAVPVTVPLYLDGRVLAEAVFSVGGADYRTRREV